MFRKMIYLLLIIGIFSLSYGKGIKAYNFELKDENGKIVKLEQFKGNVVFIIFWHPLCHSCKEELPEISLLAEKYKNKPVKFLAIVMGEKNTEKIKKIKNEWGFDIPVLIGDSEIKSKYRIIGTPIIYILRKDLTIGKIFLGKQSIDKLDKYINKFLKG